MESNQEDEEGLSEKNDNRGTFTYLRGTSLGKIRRKDVTSIEVINREVEEEEIILVSQINNKEAGMTEPQGTRGRGVEKKGEVGILTYSKTWNQSKGNGVKVVRFGVSRKMGN